MMPNVIPVPTVSGIMDAIISRHVIDTYKMEKFILEGKEYNIAVSEKFKSSFLYKILLKNSDYDEKVFENNINKTIQGRLEQELLELNKAYLELKASKTELRCFQKIKNYLKGLLNGKGF